MTDEIVSWRQGCWDRAFPVQVLEDFGGAPVLARQRRRGETVLVDLVYTH
jgi:hypothetical protein